MIDPRCIDELKALARTDDVVGRFVELKGAGRSKRGTCPFCGNEKKFGVSVAKQLYKCHACGEGGANALSFLMHDAGHKRGMPFVDAVKWLADFYHYELRHVETGTPDDAPHRAYFDARMMALGYTDDGIEKGLFRPRSDGGIEIRYPDLYAPGWQRDKDGEEFVRVRLHPERERHRQKYEQKKGTGIHIFIPPVVAQEWREGVKWPRLWVVEGEFKAYAVARPGLPVVAIAGIRLYIAGKGQKDLHPDLVQLLRHADSVSLVHDADTTEVRWDPVANPDKDLGERLRDFAGAVTGFRRAVGTHVPRVWYQRLRSELLTEGLKGLDDVAAAKGHAAVAEGLQTTKGTTDLFETFDVTAEEMRGINSLFGLNLYRGVPERFYNEHAALIGTRPFTFLGGRYQFSGDNESGKLEMLAHPDSKLFVCVAGQYYKRCHRLDAQGNPQPFLEPWPASDLMRRYVRNGVPRFLFTLEDFDGFDDVPGHHDAYKEVVEVETPLGVSRFLNRYAPLPVQPKEGSWATIEAYLKHVFGEEIVYTKDRQGNVLAQSPRWQVYLDRWTIMYRYPYQRLPVCVLASTEHNTGKSTLMDLNLAMWGENAVIIGNDALTDNFNADWIRKKYIGVDETLLEKRGDSEKIKSLVTSRTVQERGLYQGRQKRINFAVMDMTTNNPDEFAWVGADDMRWWVVIVPQYKTEDPHLLRKMVAELPALFHHLRTREIIHPEMGRLWFADSVVNTEARQEAAAQSVPWVEKEVRERIEELFYEYQWPELLMGIRQLRDEVNTNNGAKFQGHAIKRVIEKKLPHTFYHGRAFVPKKAHERKPAGISTPELGEERSGRFFIFAVEDWLPPEHAREIIEGANAEWAKSGPGRDIYGDVLPLPRITKSKFDL